MGAESGDAPLLAFAPLLRALASRFPQTALAREELVQAGYVGLLRAARRFSPEGGARFSTYAVPWALGEMRRALRGTADATGAYDSRRRLLRAEEALRAKLGRSPTAGELARASGMEDWELAQAMGALAPESLDADAGAEGTPLAERLPGGEIDVDAVDLRLALSRLGAEERRVILLRYFRDRTQAEAAATLGKSQAQISRIENRALDALRALLRER